MRGKNSICNDSKILKFWPFFCSQKRKGNQVSTSICESDRIKEKGSPRSKLSERCKRVCEIREAISKRKLQFINELFGIRSLMNYKCKSKLKLFLEPESKPPCSFGEAKDEEEEEEEPTPPAPSTAIFLASLPPNEGSAGGWFPCKPAVLPCTGILHGPGSGLPFMS